MHVSIQDLQIHYGDFHAVKDVSIEIPHGSSLVLLGPSGCGKTTTMRSIAGLENPTGGSISLGDRTVFDAAKGVNIPPNKRHVGMVFQSYAIWPHKSVYENVAFPLQEQRATKAEIKQAVTQVLEVAGLSKYADRGASSLSGGQMQRVALSRSLVMNPSVMLLDEPLSNLDALLRVKLRSELRRIQEEAGFTSIYVTHDQQEALALGDQIAMMREGRIVQVGTPEQLYDAPFDKDAAAFMGYENILAIVPGADAMLASIPVGSAEDAEEFLCLRSKDLTLQNKGGRLANGTVVSRTYQGDAYVYLVRLSDEVSVFVRVPTAAEQFGEHADVHVDIEKEPTILKAAF